ncbi:hypothetical protein J1N35_002973 [Gossypium stocksii]|uniref:Transcription initiation factor TFIID subunit 10 n=1 Tax=Gossypium stocksii TaxID=47602 RepID=A0A9D4AL04_9ROSI|nr:hypothetical protein J1N35_002973 [Gossypium stocksii]
MNHNPQSSDGKHDDDSALSDFLASLMDYAPTIPDELVEHYLAKSGFQCPDVRLIRLVAVATQKFVAEVASDALQHCKARQAAVVKDKREKQQKVIYLCLLSFLISFGLSDPLLEQDKRLILTMDDLSKSLREVGIEISTLPLFLYFSTCFSIYDQIASIYVLSYIVDCLSSL